MAVFYIPSIDTSTGTPGGDISAGGAPAQRYNLLDNSDFTNAVNQRGVTSTKARSSHIIDRWYPYFTTASSNVTVSISGNGLKVDARSAT